MEQIVIPPERLGLAEDAPVEEIMSRMAEFATYLREAEVHFEAAPQSLYHAGVVTAFYWIAGIDGRPPITGYADPAAQREPTNAAMLDEMTHAIGAAAGASVVDPRWANGVARTIGWVLRRRFAKDPPIRLHHAAAA